MSVNFTNQHSESYNALPDNAYVIITLGNPKQHCKFFGICKTEVYDATAHEVDFKILTSRCLGQCIAIDYSNKEIEIYLPYTGMSTQVMKKYFSTTFIVTNAFEFPTPICAAWGVTPFTILPGNYMITRESEGMRIYFTVA